MSQKQIQCPKQLFMLWVKVCHMDLLDLIRISMMHSRIHRHCVMTATFSSGIRLVCTAIQLYRSLLDGS